MSDGWKHVIGEQNEAQRAGFGEGSGIKISEKTQKKFEKIKLFFIKLFNKKKSIETHQDKKLKNKKSAEFKNYITVDISNKDLNDNNLKDLANILENKQELIGQLSDDKLDRLINYYKDIIRFKKQRIEKLKSPNN